jgi:hypothetical protein
VILSYPYIAFPSKTPGRVTRRTASSVHIQLYGEEDEARYFLKGGSWRNSFGYRVLLDREPRAVSASTPLV